MTLATMLHWLRHIEFTWLKIVHRTKDLVDRCEAYGVFEKLRYTTPMKVTNLGRWWAVHDLQEAEIDTINLYLNPFVRHLFCLSLRDTYGFWGVFFNYFDVRSEIYGFLDSPQEPLKIGIIYANRDVVTQYKLQGSLQWYVRSAFATASRHYLMVHFE